MVAAGGHKNIADHQNDAKVQEVAQFAVKQVLTTLLAATRLLQHQLTNCAPSQIAEKTSTKLDLVKINSAQKQVVAGLNYVLVIETAAESEKQTYEAHVYGK